MDAYVTALARERADYARSNRPDRVIPVDAELARLGWCVDTHGKLREVSTAVTAPKTKDAPVKERAVSTKANETRPA